MISSHQDHPRVAVLGASGFVGQHLMKEFVRHTIPAVGIVRQERPELPFPQRVVPDFSQPKDLESALQDMETIVHLADEAGRFEQAPVASISTVLAQIAGNRRVIFTSSIYARLDEEGTASPYGRRKREQETVLLDHTDCVALRLPPVYGEGCGGSFALLQQAVKRGIPLPFGQARALRSYLSVQNLTELIVTLATVDDGTWVRGAKQTFEPEDTTRISTRDLAEALADRHGLPARLLSIPRAVVQLAGYILGRKTLVSGAFDPLYARDNQRLLEAFGWRPKDGLPQSL